MILEKTVKNSAISVISQILILILQFVNRRIFVMFLDIEYLGYQSVFGNIFTILSVAELGIGGIISFHLYREIVTVNTKEIGKLMYLYKWIYRFIAGIVALFGLISCIFVPYIVKDSTRSVEYLYVVYLLQLMSVVSGYFMSYRRTIYVADQKAYKTIQVDLVVRILIEFITLSLLAIFRNYLIYLSVQLSTSIITNAVIYIQSNKDYPYLKERYTVTREDIYRRNLVSDVKNLLIHRISYAIFDGTDNIVISSICGIRNVALYGNYYILQTGVMNAFFFRLMDAIQTAIGNIIYSDRNKDELWQQFEMLDVFSFFLASYMGTGFLIFFQPAIQIWMGSAEYLLSDAFVFVCSLIVYFIAVWEIVFRYRSVFGDYKQDRNYFVLAAVLNIVISIMLAYRFGVLGVRIGTLIGYSPIFYGRIRFVISNYFGKSIKRYLIKHTVLFGVFLIECMVVYYFSRNMPITLTGLFFRFLIWAIIPLAMNFLVYCRSPHFEELVHYFKVVLGMLYSRYKNV